MKKLPKIIKTIIAAAIISFLISIFIHNQLIYKLRIGSSLIPWYAYLFLILFNFFLIILIHELGHLFSFVFSKIKIKALLVLIFILKKDKKWKLQIKLKNIKFIGGIVIPNLTAIKTEEEYLDLKTKFRKALIMGPITSITYSILLAIVLLVIWFFTNNQVLIAILFYSFLVTTIMTLLIHKSSKINYKNLYGDYVAYEKFSEEKFSLMQITQYLGFSDFDSLESNQFMYKKIESYFTSNSPSYQLFDVALVSYFISYFVKLKYEKSEVLEKTIKYYNINTLASKSDNLELAYLISSYYYYIGDVEKSYQLFNVISSIESKNESEKRDLLKLQYEHMLHIKDNEKLILGKREFVKSELGVLEAVFNIDDYMQELTLKLPFREYSFKYITIL